MKNCPCKGPEAEGRVAEAGVDGVQSSSPWLWEECHSGPPSLSFLLFERKEIKQPQPQEGCIFILCGACVSVCF